jgi:hypothetical protein
MPTPTRPLPQTPLPNLPPSKAATAAAILAFAAGAALLELALGSLKLGNRAEAFAFLLVRPWAVALLAVTMASLTLGWRARLAPYAVFLLLAGGSEALLLLRLGNPDPWPEMLRGWAAGAGLALIAEAILAVTGRRFRWAAVAALAILFLIPAARAGYERIISEPLPPQDIGKPAVLLMTALPLIWGEGGAFDPESRPAPLYTELQREFALKPIDSLDAASLDRNEALLLIQPRWLAPEELVALDAWVRKGGRVLILTDPTLGWVSELHPGDIRRPPAVGLLKPVLDHWGLHLEPGPGGRATVNFERGRLLQLETPGRLTPRSSNCWSERPYVAGCVIGVGRVLVFADVDLVRHELWAASAGQSNDRNRRRSDNALIVADTLEGMMGVHRERTAGDVRWRDLSRPPAAAWLWALISLAGITFGAGTAALLLSRRGRR